MFLWPHQAMANYSEGVTNSFNGEARRIKWRWNLHEVPRYAMSRYQAIALAMNAHGVEEYVSKETHATSYGIIYECQDAFIESLRGNSEGHELR